MTDGSWAVHKVRLASTFGERLAGLNSSPAEAILLHTGSVHGKGLPKPVRVIHLTQDGVVVGDELLPPGGTVGARSYWILELFHDVPVPSEGCVLRVLPSSPG